MVAVSVTLFVGVPQHPPRQRCGVDGAHADGIQLLMLVGQSAGVHDQAREGSGILRAVPAPTKLVGQQSLGVLTD